MTVTARSARCPASSANLGPGFDTLALALNLHVEVEVRPAARLTVRAEGEGHDLPTDQTHLAARVAMDVAQTEGLDITVRSQIPVARGLGSSAALAVAAAAAAGAPDPMTVAAAMEGHPENAAASVLGGFVTATMLGPRPAAARLPLDPTLAFVVLVPDRPIPTVTARQTLPPSVPHQDAAFNLGRMGLLIGGLADRRKMVREATEDRLHQQARTPLFPESPVLLAGLEDAGALAACWSGAGPCLLAICDSDNASSVRAAGERLLRESRVPGRSLLLQADIEGLVVSDLDQFLGVPLSPSRSLVAIPNPHPAREYEVRCDTSEFTCICPVTGQPDFASVTITYVPGPSIVELKSLKQYLWSYRDEGAFHEDVTNRILDDLCAAIDPRRMTVVTDWLVRGGIHTVVEASHP